MGRDPKSGASEEPTLIEVSVDADDSIDVVVEDDSDYDEVTQRSSPELRAWQQKLRELEAGHDPKAAAEESTRTALTQAKPPVSPRTPALRPKRTLPPTAPPPLGNVSLDFGARTFGRLPDELRAALVGSGQLTTLLRGARAPVASAYHVLDGELRAGEGAFRVPLRKGSALLARGSFDRPLTFVAQADGTSVVCWPGATFTAATSRYPWVEVELRQVTDRVVAICGAARGPLAERVDQTRFLATLLEFELLLVSPGELLVDTGVPFAGLCVVGAGSIVAGAETIDVGGLVVPRLAFQKARSDRPCRAGAGGALVLVSSPRGQELVLAHPALRTILAR